MNLITRLITRAARPALGMFLLACAAAAGGLAFPGGARAQDYPRLGLYGSIMGDGYPFIAGSLLTGALQDTTLDAVARYHEVILDASPISEYRKDVLTALRARRPGIKLLAYVTAATIWNPSSTDSLVHFPTRYYRRVRDLGGWLYNTAGSTFSGANVNLAKRDLAGRFVVAEALADLFLDAVLRNTSLSPTPPSWDGILLDIYCKSILWSESPTEHIDFARAGYPTLAAFDAAWGAAIDTLGNRLRRRAGPAVVMVGNCAQSTNYATFNGWMRENFPFQNGGDWYQNMFRNVGGYLPDDVNFRAPSSNVLSTLMTGALPYSGTNCRKVRFGVASAALGNGYPAFLPGGKTARPLPYHIYWYDEYAVDLATGRSSSSLQHAGWLGQPLGPYSQMVWVGPGPDAVTNPNFETDVTSGWSFTHSIPASIARDGATAGLGSASARVTVPTAGNDYGVVLGTVGQLGVGAYQPYSATFWAKASVSRSIKVVAGMWASTRIPITTEWKRYQVTLVPIDPGVTGLQFFLGEAAGDVWLDDVHFQPGVSNLYRRDFQNGIVLVNPAAQAMSVPLERDYRKILGTRDVGINDGSTVTQVTVFPSDAVFLMNQGVVLAVDPPPTPHPARTAFALRPSPNPARGEVAMTVDVARDQHVDLRVLDLSGRRVATLHSGPLATGRHAFRWGGASTGGGGVAPGVYFVELAAEDREQVVRVVRLR